MRDLCAISAAGMTKEHRLFAISCFAATTSEWESGHLKSQGHRFSHNVLAKCNEAPARFGCFKMESELIVLHKTITIKKQTCCVLLICFSSHLWYRHMQDNVTDFSPRPQLACNHFSIIFQPVASHHCWLWMSLSCFPLQHHNSYTTVQDLGLPGNPRLINKQQ